MGLFLRRRKEEAQSLQPMGQVLLQPDGTTGLEYLVRLVKQLRPKRTTDHQEAEQKLRRLLAELKNNKAALFQLQAALQTQFQKRSFVPALTESGLQRSRGFLLCFSMLPAAMLLYCCCCVAHLCGYNLY